MQVHKLCWSCDVNGSLFCFLFQTLSPDMPLQLASDTILRMLRARLHHHRQGQVCLLLILV